MRGVGGGGGGGGEGVGQGGRGREGQGEGNVHGNEQGNFLVCQLRSSKQIQLSC